MGFALVISRGAGVLRVAATPQARLDSALEDLRHVYGCDIEIEVTPHEEVERLIERLTVGTVGKIEISRAADADDIGADVRDLASQPPVIRYVNLLLADAFEAGASDIHLEATRDGLHTRYRLDGVLIAALECPPEYQHAVVSRVKLLAELDIAEKRRPQDGRIRMRLDSRELDVRVATVPTLHGESVVLRLLDYGGRPVEMADLGMPPTILQNVLRATQLPHGLFLVTGPTGSGKTTTLYAALQQRNADDEKIITLEDPIEYHLSSVTQVPVHRQAGVTFASALRSILRQDPDVIMIAEMRDTETAEIAVQAAMTGHLVLSTLHTNDALGAVPRLTDLGVPAYLIAATIEGVLAQRLVRRICPQCRAQYDPPVEMIGKLWPGADLPVEFFRGLGCPACRGTGYRGRIALFELLPINDGVRDAIAHAHTTMRLRALAEEIGMPTLSRDAWSKVAANITTVEEVVRAVSL
jgi:general secretion pathway protein E